MLYLSFKWLHIVSIISWMAGILYLFRLFVNHAEQGLTHASTNRLLKEMERKLYRIITRPAMFMAWFAGLTMISLNPSLLTGGWLHIKLLAVIALTSTTFYCGYLVKRFDRQDAPLPSGKALRLMNEVPTLLMFIIVAMVVFRPFT